MNKLLIKDEIKYTGKELSPHWIYKNFNIMGDCIVGFIGAVDVKLESMVDIEDVLNNEPIKSDKMANFIIENFNLELTEAIYRQRLFVSIIKEVLESYGHKISRDGDDLFYNGKKLSVSIATKSITSTLIHTAINLVSTGAPIDVASISDMGNVDFYDFMQKVLDKFQIEEEDIKLAKTKVRGVQEG